MKSDSDSDSLPERAHARYLSLTTHTTTQTDTTTTTTIQRYINNNLVPFLAQTPPHHPPVSFTTLCPPDRLNRQLPNRTLNDGAGCISCLIVKPKTGYGHQYLPPSEHLPSILLTVSPRVKRARCPCRISATVSMP